MHQKFRKKLCALVNQKGPILLHDNARPHVSKWMLWKLKELSYKTLPHPPYSSDLSPTDNPFFKHLDNFLQKKIINNHAAAQSIFNDSVSARASDFQ
jgi:histone-lysine N-methyltransferase SETMAR